MKKEENKNVKPSQTSPTSDSEESNESSMAPEIQPDSAEVNEAVSNEFEGPTETPPDEASEESYGNTGTWHNNKKVTALYATDHNRNTWAYFADLKWKRFEPSQSTANNAFSIFAGVARDKQRPVNVKVVNDQITELYVW